MIEGSARARLGRSLNTRSTPSAQSINLQIGEEVDFYRPPNNKDTSGWDGPATVIDVTRSTRGVVTVRWQNRVMEVQLPNIRRHLHFWTLLATMTESTFLTVGGQAWSCIQRHLGTMKAGCLIQVGHNRTQHDRG